MLNINFFVTLLFAFLMMNCANASCFDTAGQASGIDPNIIIAIAIVESNLNPNAMHLNKNHSVDIGVMQINSVHQDDLSSMGLSLSDLFEPCKNILFGTWLLKKDILKAQGDIWRGVGFYHSSTPVLRDAYMDKIHQTYLQLASLNLDLKNADAR